MVKLHFFHNPKIDNATAKDTKERLPIPVQASLLEVFSFLLSSSSACSSVIFRNKVNRH